MNEYADFERYVDVLGQLTMLQVYSHILCIFPTPKADLQENILFRLELAVNKVKHHVPWMAGKVVNFGCRAGDSGTYRITSCNPPKSSIETRNLTKCFPLYQQLEKRKAPLAMLDSELLTPCSAFPQRFEDSENDPAYCIRLQASIIDGGMILDFVTHHNTMDANGYLVFMKLIAMAMRGEEFPDTLLAEANRDRRALIPLLKPEEPMLDHSPFIRPPLTQSAPLTRSAPAGHHIFRFSAEATKRLKKLASRFDDADLRVPFISTDDVLCAFCWQRVTTIRAHRFQPDTKSRFGRAVDGRRSLGISSDYMGDMIHNAACWLSFKELTNASLATVASQLRKRLNETNTAYHIRSFATFVALEPDKSTITYGGQFNPETDFGCTSIRARQDAYMDFGPLGIPTFIRRPPTVPFPGLVVFLPSTSRGDNDISLCLLDSELAALNKDPTWTDFAEYIG